MSLVLDSSATLARCFDDGATAEIDAVFDRIAETRAMVSLALRVDGFVTKAQARTLQIAKLPPR